MTGEIVGGAAGDDVLVLFTCTANRVRSPLAAAIARRHVVRLGLPVLVGSAGQLESGRAAVPAMVAVARDLDLDLSDHQSTQLSAEVLKWSDLIVTMTGQHVIDMAAFSPDCRDRTLTLREWANAVAGGRPIEEWTPVGVRRWASGVAQRSLGSLLSGEIDIADPIGRPRRFYQQAAIEIDEALSRCFRLE